MQTPLLCAAAAAAFLACGPVAASSATASATLDSLTVTLIPLAGGPVSITFLPTGYGENYGAATAQYYIGSNSDYQSGWFQSDSSPWAPGSAAAGTAHSSSSVALGGSGQLDGLTAATSADAASPGTFYGCTYFSCSIPTSNGNGSVQAPWTSTSFVLSPNTIAVFSAQASVTATANEGGVYSTLNWDDTVYTNYNGNAANASAYFYVNGPAPGGGNGGQSANDSRYAYANSYWDGMAWVNAASADAGPLGVTFSNLTGADMQGMFYIAVNSWTTAYGNTVPVPEPGTWALLLAGLGVVGRIATRGRRG
ncbi:MAG: PEP-CTERM sorting domain-containing protein [Rubrivivax sp.]|nr:PEP-CTERM sorting domain-containing protein [Rubrivivax sp.]